MVFKWAVVVSSMYNHNHNHNHHLLEDKYILQQRKLPFVFVLMIWFKNYENSDSVSFLLVHHELKVDTFLQNERKKFSTSVWL
jgi:hypothetical protein